MNISIKKEEFVINVIINRNTEIKTDIDTVELICLRNFNFSFLI